MAAFSAKNHDYNTYVPIFRGLDARGGRKLRTDTRDTRDNHSI